MAAEVVVGIILLVLFLGAITYGYSKMIGWKYALEMLGLAIVLGGTLLLAVALLTGLITF